MNSETVAQKALAYGMDTIQIDGNDIFATYKATRDAAARARQGGGPTFIEAVTYRLGDHTTADDARRYRDQAEVDAWISKDPLIRTRKYMEAKGLWDDGQQKELDERAKRIVDEVAKTALEIEKPSPADFFDHMFAELPADLAQQRDTMRTNSLGLDPTQTGLRAQAQNA